MIRFTTATGARYTLDNGRITSTGSSLAEGDLTNVSVMGITRPVTVGERFRFIARGMGVHGSLPITTSPVVSVDDGTPVRITTGDRFVVFSCVATLASVSDTAVVLTHPALPDLHMARGDFARLLLAGTIERESTPDHDEGCDAACGCEFSDLAVARIRLGA